MLNFRRLFTLQAHVAAPIEVGSCGGGTRRIIPVTGGTFRGRRLEGEILPGGNDVQRIRSDGVAELSINVPLQTSSKQMILLKGTAVRYAPPEVAEQLLRGSSPDPAEYYFREAITFETGAEDLDWLNRVLAIGTGRRNFDNVELTVFELL